MVVGRLKADQLLVEAEHGLLDELCQPMSCFIMNELFNDKLILILHWAMGLRVDLR